MSKEKITKEKEVLKMLEHQQMVIKEMEKTVKEINSSNLELSSFFKKLLKERNEKQGDKNAISN